MVTQMFPFGNLRQGTYLQPQAGMAEEGGGGGGDGSGAQPRPQAPEEGTMRWRSYEYKRQRPWILD